MSLVPGQPVQVRDDNGGSRAGRVLAVHADAAGAWYAGYTGTFRLPDGRRGSRYLCQDICDYGIVSGPGRNTVS